MSPYKRPRPADRISAGRFIFLCPSARGDNLFSHRNKSPIYKYVPCSACAVPLSPPHAKTIFSTPFLRRRVPAKLPFSISVVLSFPQKHGKFFLSVPYLPPFLRSITKKARNVRMYTLCVYVFYFPFIHKRKRLAEFPQGAFYCRSPANAFYASSLFLRAASSSLSSCGTLVSSP